MRPASPDEFLALLAEQVHVLQAQATPAWILDAKARFPRLFCDPHRYDFRCGEGWKAIVMGLLERLDALPLRTLKVVQIKQKFGGLRVYMEGGDEEVSRLIGEAESACRTVCEWCGSAGSITNEGWMLTLCQACLLEWRRKRTDEASRMVLDTSGLSRVLKVALEVLSGEEAVCRWMSSPNRALSGAVPLSLCDTKAGCEEVEAVLRRIEHGVFS